MSAIDEMTGSIRATGVRRCGNVSKGYTSFRENDILFAKITPCMQNGKAAIARKLIGGVGFGSTEFHVLRPNPEVLPEWIFAFVRQPSFRAAAETNFTGTAGQQRVPTSFMSGSQIPVPPLTEQKRIVGILDAAKGLRCLREQADRRTADFIPALFHEMFGDPATNQKGWPVVPVSEFVAEFEGGKSIATEGDENSASIYRVLKVSAATWNRYRPEESKPVPRSYDPPAHHFVKPEDLLFSRANTTELVGATVYVFDTPPNLLLPDKLWRFVWREPRKADPLFIRSLFLDPSVRRELGRRASGTSGSMKNISKPKVMSMKVPLPRLFLQRDFAARIAGIRAMETNQAASRLRLDDLFQSLLHRAFTGEL